MQILCFSYIKAVQNKLFCLYIHLSIRPDICLFLGLICELIQLVCNNVILAYISIFLFCF